jgi:hypothetical protein
MLSEFEANHCSLIKLPTYPSSCPCSLSPGFDAALTAGLDIDPRYFESEMSSLHESLILHCIPSQMHRISITNSSFRVPLGVEENK